LHAACVHLDSIFLGISFLSEVEDIVLLMDFTLGGLCSLKHVHRLVASRDGLLLKVFKAHLDVLVHLPRNFLNIHRVFLNRLCYVLRLLLLRFGGEISVIEAH
jgi:hypothetical protein